MKQAEKPNHLRYWQIASAVLLIALCGVVLHVYVLSPAKSIEESLAQYPFIDPARNFIPQEHFLSTLQPLRERVHALVDEEAKKGMRVSVYIEFLNTGASISVNQEDRYWPASLAKIPVAMAVMGAIESGVWTREQPLTLEDSDRARAPSTIHENPTGTKFTVDQLLEGLLVRSDNTALQILIRNVPQSELDAVREGIGLQELFNSEGEISAREYSRLFRSLYTASYLNRENSQYLLEKLSRAEWRNFLAGAISQDVPFPHKYGLEPFAHTYSDSGIVYVPNRPYLITVMLEGDGSEDDIEEAEHAGRVMGAISQMAYLFFTTAQNREL